MAQVKFVKRNISRKEALEGFNTLLEAYNLQYVLLHKKEIYGAIALILNDVLMYMNNEEAYDCWLWHYPDGETIEEAIEDFGTKKDLSDLFLTFIRIYNDYREDGLFFPKNTNRMLKDSTIKLCETIDKIFDYKDIEVF